MVFSIADIESRIQNRKFDGLTKLRLNVDAYRLLSKYKFDPVSVVSIGKIDPLPHQVDAFVKMMAMLRPKTGISGQIRMLLADDVGLGKTIMVGLVMKELILRGRLDRILIVCPSGLQIQWKEEMTEKFNEEFKIIRGKVGGNPYEEYNRAIISVDIGRNEEKTKLLQSTNWDLIIFDEAHKLKPGNLRYEVAAEICKNTDHLILASATPHDGKVENFLGLVKLIDTELENNYDSGELKKYLEPLMIRRLKEDIVNFKGKKIFPKRREPATVEIEYSEDELDFYNAVEDYVRTYYQKAEDSGRSSVVLALYILNRRVSSSIEAGVNSLIKRKNRLLEPFQEEADNGTATNSSYIGFVDDFEENKREEAEEKIIGTTASQTPEELREEIEHLEYLIDLGNKIIEEDADRKYKKLATVLNKIRSDNPEDKVIIFTEFTDTLRFLERKLTGEEGFTVAKIKGGMTIEEKKEQSLFFENKANILLGTEAAGEGLNLQFANIAINYELPWNPNRLEQRIGRVYRYGQKKEVFIYNFKTAFSIDNAVLEKIFEKMANIRAIFGDSAIDVIGSLISEKDILEIFKVSRSKGAGPEEVEKIFDEKLEVFKNIDRFLIKEKFNLSDASWMKKDVSRSINNFDIERFMLTYAEDNPDIDVMPQSRDNYSFIIPEKEFSGNVSCIEHKLGSYGKKSITGVFDPNKKGKYISLGHPVLNYAIDDIISNNCISLIKYKEKGLLLNYLVRFYNGLEEEIYSEPLLLLKTETDEKVIDGLWIWDMQGINPVDSSWVKFDGYSEMMGNCLGDEKLLLDRKISEIEKYVLEKNEKDIETEYSFIHSEYEWKIKNQRKKKQIYTEKGQTYLVAPVDAKISELKNELRDILDKKDSAKNISYKICGPVNVALLIPEAEEYRSRQGSLSVEAYLKLQQLKRDIELKGMEHVIQYEYEHGRTPEDVSAEMYLGYDILSKSRDEIRYIEVKSFSKENPIEISSNEWRMASHHGEDYYLYVVQYISEEPRLTIIQNPFETISEYVKKVPIEDFKMVLNKLVDDIPTLNE